MSDENRHFGLQTENRFYYAMKSLPAALRPRWFFKFREATNREDGEGTDFFAGLDVGEAPLQVKSSEVGLLKYILEDHPDKDAIVIVVKPTDSPEAIRTGTLALLAEWRESRLRCMPRWRTAWGPIANFSLR